jgi:uncharacterized protein (TIGR02145 family)
MGPPYLPGDSVTLVAVDYVAGELQWQYSFDQQQWHDFEGKTGLQMVFYPTMDTYLRLKITDPACPPAYYTDTRLVALSDIFRCGDTLTDPRDGQSYPTVVIGDRCWMARNLNVGTMVPGNVSQTDPELIQKYCYGNDPDNCDRYGGLYQWNQVMDYTTAEGARGICPPGWHVPTDQEYKELEMALGMSPEDADRTGFRGFGIGTRMKAGGTSGFEALMGGGRTSGGTWIYIEGSSTEFGYFYTSTESVRQGNAFRRCLRSASSAVGRYDSWPKTYGLSVRCIKDE